MFKLSSAQPSTNPFLLVAGVDGVNGGLGELHLGELGHVDTGSASVLLGNAVQLGLHLLLESGRHLGAAKKYKDQ